MKSWENPNIDFIDQLALWASESNFEELNRCEFKVVEMLRNWGRVATEMEVDKESFLWKEPLALAVQKDLRRLKAAIKKVDKVYKAKAKEEKLVQKK